MPQGRFRFRAFSSVFARTWRGLKEFLFTTPRPDPRPSPSSWQLVALEDRRLLNATPIGAEFRVNTYTKGPQQTFPQTPQAVAVNPTTGDFVVTWSSQGQNGGGWNVYFQRFSARGLPQGPATPVAAKLAGSDQQFAAVAMAPNGNFVITWSNNLAGLWNVEARLFSAAGAAQGSSIPVTLPGQGDQQYSSVAMDGKGNFVITWSGRRSGDWNVYAQEFNKNGTAVGGGTFAVSKPVNGQDQMYSSVAMNATGNFVITWSGHQSGNWDVYAQRYAASGNPRGPIFLVNATTTNDQGFSTAALEANGNFVITWSGRQSGHWDVYAQRYSASGAAQGSEFQVNTSTQSDQKFSSVAMNTAGFLITWSSHDQDGSGWGIFGQAYDNTGNIQGNDIQVNTYTKGDQGFSSTALDDNGRAVVVWSSQNQDGDNWGVYGQRYNLAPSSIVLGPTTGLVTAESGQSATFTVALATQPAAPVTISLNSSDPSQGMLSQTTLTFDAGNWNVAQKVTVTGLDDHIVHGDQTYQITGTASSSDTSYDGLTMAPLTVVNKEADVAGFTVTPNAGLVTTDVGGSATFTVDLTSQPTAPVVIQVFSNNTNRGVVSTSRLIFDATNWNVPQTVTVTGVDSDIRDAGPYTILLAPAISADPVYRGLQPSPVSVTNLEGDFFGALVKPVTGLVTTEAGGTATFRVVLTNWPAADVTIPVASSNPQAGVVSTSALTFTSSNWNVPQTVTVTGVDDHMVTGNVAYRVVLGPMISADANYDRVVLPSVRLINQEMDVAGIRVTPTVGLQTTSAGGTASFQMVLTSQPSTNVLIGLTSSNPQAGTVSQSAVLFTPANWNVAQTVTVTAQSAPAAGGSQSFRIIPGPALSGDANYQGRTAAEVTVINRATVPLPVATPPGGGATVLSGASASALAPSTNGPGNTSTPSPVPGVAAGMTGGSVETVAGPSAAAGFIASAGRASTGAADQGAGVFHLPPEASVGSSSSPEASGRSFTRAFSSAERGTLFSTAGPTKPVGVAASGTSFTPSFNPGPPVILFEAPPRPAGQTAAPQNFFLLDALDDSAEPVSSPETLSQANAMAVTGLLASAGYVLLNTRAGFWLLSLLTAKPLWKEFDPMEVLFAWEKEKESAPDTSGEQETLVSLVS